MSWLERVTTFKDGLLASSRFRRLATRFPLTRIVARRRAQGLFDLCAGFVYSQVLLACIELGLFEILRQSPQTPESLSRRTGIPPESALRLLKAAASLRLAQERRGGRFGLGALGAALVDNPAIEGMVSHHVHLYDDLRDPIALLRSGRGEGALRRYWAYAEEGSPEALGAERFAAYTTLMGASQPLIADEILGAYPPRGRQHWLDVGGGDGSFIVAAAAHAPAATFTLFDLPAVAESAKRRVASAGLADRVSCIGGNFLRDPLPTGADVVSLIRVIHDHDDPAAVTILRAARAALSPHGALLLAEPMAGVSGAERVGDAYFGFYLLAMGQGRARPASELRALLERAGFTRMNLHPTRMPMLASVLVARP